MEPGVNQAGGTYREAWNDAEIRAYGMNTGRDPDRDRDGQACGVTHRASHMSDEPQGLDAPVEIFQPPLALDAWAPRGLAPGGVRGGWWGLG